MSQDESMVRIIRENIELKSRLTTMEETIEALRRHNTQAVVHTYPADAAVVRLQGELAAVTKQRETAEDRLSSLVRRFEAQSRFIEECRTLLEESREEEDEGDFDEGLPALLQAMREAVLHINAKEVWEEKIFLAERALEDRECELAEARESLSTSEATVKNLRLELGRSQLKLRKALQSCTTPTKGEASPVKSESHIDPQDDLKSLEEAVAERAIALRVKEEAVRQSASLAKEIQQKNVRIAELEVKLRSSPSAAESPVRAGGEADAAALREVQGERDRALAQLEGVTMERDHLHRAMETVQKERDEALRMVAVSNSAKEAAGVKKEDQWKTAELQRLSTRMPQDEAVVAECFNRAVAAFDIVITKIVTAGSAEVVHDELWSTVLEYERRLLNLQQETMNTNAVVTAYGSELKEQFQRERSELKSEIDVLRKSLKTLSKVQQENQTLKTELDQRFAQSLHRSQSTGQPSGGGSTRTNDAVVAPRAVQYH